MISALEANEWALFRELRLSALEDSPDAFSPTYAETAVHDEAYWRDAARRFAENERAALLIARPRRGLVSAVADADDLGHIGAMWVDPAARDRKLGSALLDAGLEFLERVGCEAVELSVTETNVRAIGLYESRGFELTGAHEPLRESSELRNLYMRRRSAAGGGRT